MFSLNLKVLFKQHLIHLEEFLPFLPDTYLLNAQKIRNILRHIGDISVDGQHHQEAIHRLHQHIIVQRKLRFGRNLGRCVGNITGN